MNINDVGPGVPKHLPLHPGLLHHFLTFRLVGILFEGNDLLQLRQHLSSDHYAIQRRQ